MSLIPGRLNRLYVSDDGGSTFTLLGCLQDATLTPNVDEIDATCKDSPGGYRDWLAGFSDGSIDGTIAHDKDDAGQQILRTAGFGKSTIRARWRMEEVSGADENIADCIVTSFPQDAPRDDLGVNTFTLRLKGDFSPTAQA